jgi:hypothetical protein
MINYSGTEAAYISPRLAEESSLGNCRDKASSRAALASNTERYPIDRLTFLLLEPVLNIFQTSPLQENVSRDLDR